jgi:4-amino-4-deoxy-L-arabinose transferase-like glycosyltransferase
MASPSSSFWIEPVDSHRNLRVIRSIFWLVTFCAGFLQAWASRFFVSPDGNCYLDIASAYLRGDWKNAVNAYWSPLFSWLLALTFAVFHPSPYWESTLLHLLNLAGLLVGLRCFEFFFRAFLRARQLRSQSGDATETLPELGWWILGYGLFLSTSLLVSSVTITTPDVWVAVFTFIIAGLVLKIQIHGGGWHWFAALGASLGCAYLTKTFYFPLSFVFLLAAWMATGNPLKTAKQSILALLVFLAIAGPWVVTLSRSKHRATFGDVGKLAFATLIDNIPQPFFWQGEDNTGIPAHPVRQLLKKPRLFEFATPIGGTYPPAYDWSYWMEGVRPHFSRSGQFRALRQSAGTFFQIGLLQIEYGVVLLVLFYLSWGNWDWFLHIREHPYVWLPALIACLSYTIVLVENRYVAPFIPLLWLAALSAFLGTASHLSRRVAIALVLAVVSVTGLRIAKSAVSDFAVSISKRQNMEWTVATELRGLGVMPGDKVAGLSRVAEAHWARLAGVQIVAEIPLGDEGIFWSAAPEEKRKVFEIFATTGASVVVTRNPPIGATEEGWIPLGNTTFYAYRLPRKPI